MINNIYIFIINTLNRDWGLGPIPNKINSDNILIKNKLYIL